MLLIGIPTVLVACIWLWPLARYLLKDAPVYEPLAFFCGLGLSLGGLSVLMLWLGLPPGAWLQPGLVLLIPWMGLAVSTWLMRTSLLQGAKAVQTRFQQTQWFRAQALSYWLGLVCLAALLIVVINLVSYPFYTYDVLVRYGPNARDLFLQAHIPTSLTGYPLGVQLLYAFGFMAAGGVNDHVAGIFSAALAVGLVGSTWLVSRLLISNRAAWVAAILTLAAPLFVSWSTSAYIDIPEGFYHGLTFVMAHLWLKRGDTRYAVLGALFGALSIWVKHSSLSIVPALGVVPLLRLTWPLSLRNLRREFGLGLLVLAVIGLIVGPWFFRSYLLTGAGGVFPAPSTFDATQVDHSWGALLAFWGRRDQWGWPLALGALAGLLLLIVAFFKPVRSGFADESLTRKTILMWAAFVVPYHFIWWWGFSYQDSRYLFASWPMYVLLAGLAFEWLFSRLPIVSRVPWWATAAVCTALVGYSFIPRMGAVYYLVSDPQQTDDTKLMRRAPDTWPMAKYIRENLPAGSTIYSMDGSLAYWLGDYTLDVGFPTRRDDLRGYDYYIVASWGSGVLSAIGANGDALMADLQDPALFTKLYTPADTTLTLYSINFQ
jgi:Dolichyl-phosphate-mannose-protein mannosyltransferase